MSADTGEGAAPLRADALRNRRKIIAAAKEVFAARGPHIPMEDVARRAGVGVATLYRRFPDRESLIRAVAQDTFARVLEESRTAVAEEPGAWEALVRMLRSSRELTLSVQLALESSLAREVIRGDPVTGRFRDELLDVLDHVVRAAQGEGTLRTDVGGGDVAVLLSLLLRPTPVRSKWVEASDGAEAEAAAGGGADGPAVSEAGDAGRGSDGARETPVCETSPAGPADDVSERALALMLDGLRAREGNASLPGKPLSVGDFDVRAARAAGERERRRRAERKARGDGREDGSGEEPLPGSASVSGSGSGSGSASGSASGSVRA
ncbi:TetR/AcrR family transcriptional regulator [Streptomyces marispadix]|uniref:TetR/AcrR family transcriptional regulator n=1 Tax=Streptomyces marispadix TaxID=2922868 RepID=A0ABS9SX89_9ACTN|nr:TetR/AcrR family transcriptional regulator [Streptomyces marispadix]MCH6160870.1 TetR/AcrR family transcriptional regulator [Streptomyces marispadix]